MHSEFFQDFGNPFANQQRNPTPEEQIYKWNSMVLEIYNNWPWVQWLMWRRQTGKLQKIDAFETEWFKFLLNNNIKVLEMEKGDEGAHYFLEKYFKKG